MEDHEPNRRDKWLLVEFWFALLLTVGTILYGAWNAVGALAGKG